MKDSLYKRLMSYVDEGYVPMHMPGAKRNADLVDMTNMHLILLKLRDLIIFTMRKTF